MGKSNVTVEDITYTLQSFKTKDSFRLLQITITKKRKEKMKFPRRKRDNLETLQERRYRTDLRTLF